MINSSINARENVNVTFCLDESCPQKTLKCLLTHGANSKEDNSKIFKDLLSLNSRLHQIPKFFVKLLLALTECVQENHLGKLVRRGKIPMDVSNHIVKIFQELPYGQTIELWVILLETYSIFVNMSEVLPQGRGAVFFLAQIFSSFLLHSRLLDSLTPSSIISKFEDLIHSTDEELEKNVSILSSEIDKTLLLQKSFLLICFSLGEVKLAFHNSGEGSVKKSSKVNLPSNVLHFSFIQSVLKEQHSQIFESFLRSEDKILSFLTFQLLVQNIKGLIIFKKEHSTDDLTYLNESFCTVLHHGEENSCFEKMWDSDISSLNASSYGNAIWRVLLTSMPVLLKYVKGNSALSFCVSFQRTLLDCISRFLYLEDSKETSLLFLSTLKSEFVQESRDLQTLFIAALWKNDKLLMNKKRSNDEVDTDSNILDVLSRLGIFRSKWLKYINTIPKIKETLNPMWISLQSTCNLLNTLLKEKRINEVKIDASIYNVTKIISCFPLEYLLPVNQVRISVGLSSLFFLIPEIFPSDNGLEIAEEIAMLLTSVLDGVRNIWLFDLVDSGLYLKQTIKTIHKIMGLNYNFDSFKWSKLLLEHTINLCVRNKKRFSNLELCVNEIMEENNPSESSTLVLSLILKQLSLMSSNIHFTPDFKEICERIFISTSSICMKYLKEYKHKQPSMTYNFIISSYTEVISILCGGTLKVQKHLIESCLKPLTKVINIIHGFLNQKLNHSKFYSTYLQFCAKICKHKERLHIFIPENTTAVSWKSIYQYIQLSPSELHSSHSESLILKECQTELLQSVFPTLSQEEIDGIFQDILTQMTMSDTTQLDPIKLQMDLCLLIAIIENISKIPTSEYKIPKERFFHLQTILHNIVSKIADTEDNICNIKIPILSLIHFIIRLHTSVIPNQFFIHCFYLCTAINLNQIEDLKLFAASFNAIWAVVYSLFMEKPIVLSGIVVPAFVSILTSLLKCLISAGSQDRILAHDNQTQQLMSQCAQNMERLFQMISRQKQEFSRVVPYLLADYVNSVQNVTLETNIKEHLLAGLYKVMKLCNEDIFKMLAVNINSDCADIYSNIIKNYKQQRFSLSGL